MLNPMTLHGIIPPIVTPLTEDGSVDPRSLARLVGFLLDSGVHGIWPTGTTGEFACFTADERELIVRTSVEAAAGRVPVVANAGDCSTRLALDHARRAARAGVDALGLTPPYYYSNSQEELLALYRDVRAAVDVPLLVYNIPQTTKVRFEVETVLRLAEEGIVIGVKDSQNDLDWVRQLVLGAERRGVALRIFLGTRALIDAGIVIGAHGAISSIANVAPAACVAAYEAAVRGDWPAAADAQRAVMAANAITRVMQGSAHAAAFGGLKAALKAMGIISTAKVAAPLRSPNPDEETQIAALVHSLGLTK